MPQPLSLSAAIRSSILKSSLTLLPAKHAGFDDASSFVQGAQISSGRLASYKNKFADGKEMLMNYHYSGSTGRVDHMDLLTASGKTIRLSPTYDASGNPTGTTPSFV
jgi:hypothetical protein